MLVNINGVLQKFAGNFKNLIGQTFNLLTVLDIDHRKDGRIFWKCKCLCGNIAAVETGALKNGNTKSCGCLIGKKSFIDLTGKKFNRLFVVRFSHFKKNRSYFVMLCDCGKETIKQGNLVSCGQTRSCGCLALETRTKHGKTTHSEGAPVYRSWVHMISRCNNPNNDAYKDYGGRGIRVCDEWLQFENFYRDMGDRPQGKSIDRIEVMGNYEPSNCKWSTRQEQSRNTRCSTNTVDYDQHVFWKGKLSSTINRVLRCKTKYFVVFEHYVGCTSDEFRIHIESQFEPWMNWDNYGSGKGKWNIDHILGYNNFDLSKEEDRLACSNYKNLRPYDAIKNSKKQRRELVTI